MALLLLFLLIPVLGWPIGLAIGAAGFIAMYIVHDRRGCRRRVRGAFTIPPRSNARRQRYREILSALQ